MSDRSDKLGRPLGVAMAMGMALLAPASVMPCAGAGPAAAPVVRLCVARDGWIDRSDARPRAARAVVGPRQARPLNQAFASVDRVLILHTQRFRC